MILIKWAHDSPTLREQGLRHHNPHFPLTVGVLAVRMFWDFRIYSCHTLAQVYDKPHESATLNSFLRIYFFILLKHAPTLCFPKAGAVFCRRRRRKWWAPHWFWLTSLSNLHRFTDALWSSCKMWQYTFLLAALLTSAVPASEGCCLRYAHPNILVLPYITEIAASRRSRQQFSERQIIENQVPSSLPCRHTMSIMPRPLCLSAQN